MQNKVESLEGNVAFVGAGNMGEALIRGILSSGVVPQQRLLASDPRERRRAFIQETYGIRCLSDNLEVVRGANVVVLAVKPQILAPVLDQIRDALEPDVLVVSIAAGKGAAAGSAAFRLMVSPDTESGYTTREVVHMDDGAGGRRDRLWAPVKVLEKETIKLQASVSADNTPVSAGFELVLVDAPCSGIGTLRRHPEIRFRRGPQDLERLHAIQVELLMEAAGRVAPGGLLAYTVCTVTREEGEDTINEFLAQAPDFELDLRPPASESILQSPSQGSPGVWRFWPYRHGCDGYTIARFIRHR